MRDGVLEYSDGSNQRQFHPATVAQLAKRECGVSLPMALLLERPKRAGLINKLFLVSRSSV